VPDPSGRYRAIVNTYLSLVACTVCACAVSSLVHPKSKIRMDHIQNATLAGGVAVGACGNFLLYPWGALLLGSIAGTLSVLGYTYLTPLLTDKFQCFDTCGVHNLHGMPGLLSAAASILGIRIATESQYGLTDFVATFPQRNPHIFNATTQENSPNPDAWSAGHQAGIQALALGITLVIAIVGGIMVGLVVRLPFFQPLLEHELYEDEPFWEMPSEDEEELDNQTVTKRRVEQHDNGVMQVTTVTNHHH
jgi:ammonium transporter Rh